MIGAENRMQQAYAHFDPFFQFLANRIGIDFDLCLKMG